MWGLPQIGQNGMVYDGNLTEMDDLGPCFRKPSYMPVQNPVYGTFLSSI